METFSALLALCAGNSPVTGEFPSQRPVRRSFDVFFDLRLNKRLSKQSCGWWFETPSRPLWRHCNVFPTPYSVCIVCVWGPLHMIPCHGAIVRHSHVCFVVVLISFGSFSIKRNIYVNLYSAWTLSKIQEKKLPFGMIWYIFSCCVINLTGSGLLSDFNKPLSDSMLTCHWRGSDAFAGELFHSQATIFCIMGLKIILLWYYYDIFHGPMHYW